MKEVIRIDMDEMKELTDKIYRSMNMPVIMIKKGSDLSSEAWEEAKQLWKNLGVKYAFNPDSVDSINPLTGEIVFKKKVPVEEKK